MKRYESYKHTDSKWFPEVPSHWDLKRTKTFLHEVDEKSENGSETLLSVSQYTGVTETETVDEEGNQATRASDLNGYQIVKKDQLVSNIMLAWNGSLGVSNFDGIVSPAYCVYQFNTDTYPQYYHYLFRTQQYKDIFKMYSKGIVDSRLRLYTEYFYQISAHIPPPEEQRQIARYLDHKHAQIERFIRNKRRLIALLKEQKQSLINTAVTKGLDHNSPMKDSGIEWLGEIPKHWEVKKLKYLCKITTGGRDTKDRVDDGEYPFFVRSQTSERIDTYSYDGEGILTAGDGAGVGKVFHHVNGKFDYHQRVYLLYQFQDIEVIFLFEYFRNILLEALLPYSAKSTVESLRLPMLANLPVPIPSVMEQQQIVDHLEKETQLIATTIARAEREIELMQEYRDRLVADVVTGQVDVRDVPVPDAPPKTEPATPEPTAL